MDVKQAYDLMHQLARLTAVNGEVGDKRDEALAVLREMVEADKPKPKR